MVIVVLIATGTELPETVSEIPVTVISGLTVILIGIIVVDETESVTVIVSL